MLVRTFLAIDPPRLRARIARLLTDPAVVALEGGGDVLDRVLAGESCDLGLVSRESLDDDPARVVTSLRSLADRPDLVVVRAGDDAEDRARLLAAGCLAVLDHELDDGLLAETLQNLVARRREVAIDRLRAVSWRRSRAAEPAAASSGMKKLLAAAERVAAADSPILILGETGVGKEWLARRIHELSPRREERFLAINCAAVPEQLIKSELFGHVKGAFTGADRPRRGCFELAHRGTLLLDEIGEMPPHLQSRLLRALEEGEIRRVGSERALAVDARVMAATSRDLDRARAAGRFRDDLFYRLAVVTLEVPPLRHRREDIASLAGLFVERTARKLDRPSCHLDRTAVAVLTSHSWPGNVRELVNLIERTVLFLKGDLITGDDVRTQLGARAGGDVRGLASVEMLSRLTGEGWTDRPFAAVRREVLAELERRYLEAQLRTTGGRIADAARRAGLTARSLHRMMARNGLKKEDYQQRPAAVATLHRQVGRR